jgi:hypothetical protein
MRILLVVSDIIDVNHTGFRDLSVFACGCECFVEAFVDSDPCFIGSREGFLEQNRRSHNILCAVQNASPSIRVALDALGHGRLASSRLQDGRKRLGLKLKGRTTVLGHIGLKEI